MRRLGLSSGWSLFENGFAKFQFPNVSGWDVSGWDVAGWDVAGWDVAGWDVAEPLAAGDLS
ncbi:MAG: hypothetical protein ACPGLY_15410 [Rubripirellula sp.]